MDRGNIKLHNNFTVNFVMVFMNLSVILAIINIRVLSISILMNLFFVVCVFTMILIAASLHTLKPKILNIFVLAFFVPAILAIFLQVLIN